MNFFGIKFKLPAPAVPVAKREMTVVINSEPATVYTLPGSALVSDEIVFAETDSYNVSLVDVSETGHRSPVSPVQRGSIADELCPAAPAMPETGDKRHLTEADAAAVKAENAKKAADEAKDVQEKEAAYAKTVADAKAAHDKALADAKKPAPIAPSAPRQAPAPHGR